MPLTRTLSGECRTPMKRNGPHPLLPLMARAEENMRRSYEASDQQVQARSGARGGTRCTYSTATCIYGRICNVVLRSVSSGRLDCRRFISW